MNRPSNRKRKQSWVTLDTLVAQAVVNKMSEKPVVLNRILATVQHKHKAVYHGFAIWLLAQAMDAKVTTVFGPGGESFRHHSDEQRKYIHMLQEAHARVLMGEKVDHKHWNHIRSHLHRVSCRELAQASLVNLSRYKHAPHIQEQTTRLIEMLQDEKHKSTTH